METRANYVIVGIFTLVAILAAFAFVYWTAAIGDRGETTMLRVRIPGSASGLGRGSFVLFNGVKVGDVRRVYIDVSNPTVAIADTEIDRSTPITKSTQADIGLAGLTGQANIELKGANPSEPKLLDEAEKEGKVAEIVANPSAVTNLLQTAQDIFNRADKVLSQLEGFTQDVRGPLTETVQNAQKFSEALARNSDGVDKFLASVSSLAQELQGVSAKLDGMRAVIEAEAPVIAGELGVGCSIEPVGHFDPVTFDPALVGRVRSAAERLGYSHMDIISGAGHDACWAAKVAPATMVMCPCVDGLSHNEDEAITPEWAAASSRRPIIAVTAAERSIGRANSPTIRPPRSTTARSAMAARSPRRCEM